MARAKYQPGPQPPVPLRDKLVFAVLAVLCAAVFAVFFWIGRYL